MIGDFAFSGSTLYEAIVSGNIETVRKITKSDSSPAFSLIRKEGAEPNLLIVARNNPEILACLLDTYGSEFDYNEPSSCCAIFT